MEERTLLICENDEAVETIRTSDYRLWPLVDEVNRHQSESSGQTEDVTTDQPYTQAIDLEVATLDITEIKTTRTKAVTSIVLSALASLSCITLFCTVPAIIFAILALRSKTKDPSAARSRVQISLILVGVAWSIIAVGFFLYIVLNSILFNSYY